MGDAETVEVSTDAARVARRELGILIGESAPRGENGQPMTPTARIRQRLAEELPEDAAVQAVDIVDAVAEETGAENSPIDPLQADIFRAETEFDTAPQEDR